MTYQALAQKYRPQIFDDVVGQESAAKTLKNSILNDRIANAYIFCGPRGVGKTSIARLLSKMLNCQQPPEKSPCNKCVSCEEITKGSSIDVLEIDGASNRGIDEIRTLRENVKFSPSRGKYKVYIIDEVHMLTTEAFNALLKTLEEPPSHVKFMFATTEPHKVLPTIMSRCQRFDLKKIPPKLIFDRIMYIAGKEGISIDEKAALLISRSSEGSLRDALVVLDQMVSFSDKEVKFNDVVELLGMVHKDKMFELAGAIIENRTEQVAVMIDELINSGKDPAFVANSLINHYRDLMILKTSGEPTSDMAFSDEELARLKGQAAGLSLEEILYILQNLTHCLTLMKSVISARAPLEIALIRLTKRGVIMSMPDILERLNRTGADTDSTPDENITDQTYVASGGQSDDTLPDVERGGDPPVVDFNASKVHWKSILNYVRNKKMSAFAFLAAGKLVEFSPDKVTIGFDKDHEFNRDALETGNRDVVEEAVNKVTGGTPHVEFRVVEFPGDETKAKEAAEQKIVSREKMKPIIEKAMDVFGGHVVRDVTEEQA